MDDKSDKTKVTVVSGGSVGGTGGKKKPEDLLAAITNERQETALKAVKSKLKEIDDRKEAALTTIRLCDLETAKVIDDFNKGIFVPPRNQGGNKGGDGPKDA